VLVHRPAAPARIAPGGQLSCRQLGTWTRHEGAPDPALKPASTAQGNNCGRRAGRPGGWRDVPGCPSNQRASALTTVPVTVLDIEGDILDILQMAKLAKQTLDEDVDDKVSFAVGHLRNMIETLKAKCYGPAEAR
jgi:hypothetical protein